MVTVAEYTRFVPATTDGVGAVVKPARRSADAGPTVVVAEAPLFPVLRSGGVEAVVALTVRLVPGIAAGGTPAAMVTERAAPAPTAVAPGQVQLTVPVAPTAGEVQLPPVLAAAELNVVPAAIGKLMLTSLTLPGPLLVAVAT